MSTSATGRVLRSAGGLPWVGLMVTATDVSALVADIVLDRRPTDAGGGFTLTYADDGRFVELGPRRFVVEVTDGVGRRLARVELDDVAEAVLVVPDIVVRPADGEGFAVTLGTGTPVFRSGGNEFIPLIDNRRAWGHLAELFLGAQSRIEIMQLDFEIPPNFAADPGAEKPALVFRFGDPGPDVAPRGVGVQDDRPERVLLTRALDGQVEVRILLNRVFLGVRGLAVGMLVGFAFPPLFLLILPAMLIGPLLFELGLLTAVNKVSGYFAQAGRPEVTVRGMRTSIFARTHAKLAVVDGMEAVSIASPFLQSYFGDERHSIDDPRRGGGHSFPYHDVSAAVRGPAVADLHEAFRLHWNTAGADEPPIPAIDRPPARDGADTVTLQVVRTLPAGRFDAPGDGEQGVLEAYLRAIAAARKFIYLENQYFTNDMIGAALLAALQDPGRPELRVILLINIEPDVPDYPVLQNTLIDGIRAKLTGGQLLRFGIFTRWTYETDGTRGRIVPDYVHSKVGIVDDLWATVGSANLDGSSLDYTQMFHGTFGDARNSEVNVVVLPQPGAGVTPVVERLRRQLWAEHLGFEIAAGVPAPDESALGEPASGDWLAVWNQRTEARLTLLRADPAKAGAAHVLPWPDRGPAPDTPRSYLADLAVREPRLDVVRATRQFDLGAGTWSSSVKLDD